jgi:TonB family protein
MAMDKKVKTATFSMQIQAPDPQKFVDIRTFVDAHIKSPQELNAADIKGYVEISFKVEDDGTFTEFDIIRSLTPEVDAEIIHVLKSYPKKPIIKDAQGNPQRMKNTRVIKFPKAD